MNALDPRDRFEAQAFESLLDGALDFLLRRLEVIEGRAVAVAECSPAADHRDSLTAPDRIATMVS